MADVQQNIGILGQQGISLAAVFKSSGDPCFLPSSIIANPQTNKALQLFISENQQASRIFIVLDSSPQSNEALSTVSDIRATIKSTLGNPAFNGYQVAVGGTTASLADMRSILDSDFTRVQIVVLCGIFIVFAVLLRSLVAPVYLLLTVLLSYATTLGLISWIFQGLMGQNGISFIVPIVVFVLLVALGADYNIFLMSRVREESEVLPTKEATRTAAGITGAVITACGIILAGTFAALLVSPIRIMVQVGTAVAIGIIIDTFIVRSLVVPAIATLVGRWNWWPSRLSSNNKKRDS
jgi:RND superfamily putative drug exporter